MDELWRERKWEGRLQKHYPDVSCKDAPVLAPFPSPKCECDKPAAVTQSMHPDTAARAYYKCGDHRPWEQCKFFQWIDGPEMVDPRILLFRPKSAQSYESFRRWVPPPPNPPKMTADEKKEAIARRLANPPLCYCGDPAKIHRGMPDSPYTPIFKCRNRTKTGYPVCNFSEYDYGPKSYWPEEETDKKRKPKERSFIVKADCDAGPSKQMQSKQMQSNDRIRSVEEILMSLDPCSEEEEKQKRIRSDIDILQSLDPQIVQELYPDATREFQEQVMREIIGHLPKEFPP